MTATVGTWWKSARTTSRLGAAWTVGVAAAVVGGLLSAWRYAPLIGWDAAAVVFTGWVWAAIGPMDPRETDRHARREDPNRALADGLLLGASIASLVAVGVVLVAASSAHGSRQGWLAGLAVLSVALSWFLVHTLFTLRYAALYHRTGSGISFNQDDPPRYVDFAYLAFTVGMTFQVSDTAIGSTPIRSAALRHALLSYLFGSVILATTVNFIVSLSSSG